MDGLCAGIQLHCAQHGLHAEVERLPGGTITLSLKHQPDGYAFLCLFVTEEQLAELAQVLEVARVGTSPDYAARKALADLTRVTEACFEGLEIVALVPRDLRQAVEQAKRVLRETAQP